MARPESDRAAFRLAVREDASSPAPANRLAEILAENGNGTRPAAGGRRRRRYRDDDDSDDVLARVLGGD